MEKVERTKIAGATYADMLAKQDEIIDWINAHDSADDGMIQKFKDIANGQYQRHIEAYHDNALCEGQDNVHFTTHM